MCNPYTPQRQYLGQTSRELQIKVRIQKYQPFELAKEAPFYEEELVDICSVILDANVDVIYWTSKEWVRFEEGNYEFKHEIKIFRDKERQQLITALESQNFYKKKLFLVCYSTLIVDRKKKTH